MQGGVRYFIAINIMFFVYPLMSVLGKMAARENEINIRFNHKEATADDCICE